MAEETLKTRYSDVELEEFRVLIEKKMSDARREYERLRETLNESNENHDLNAIWNPDESSDLNDKEYLTMMMSRQAKFMHNLEMALGRIANKTYGICKVTGKLIDKRRLMAVPHTTLSIEAKLTQPGPDDRPAVRTEEAPSTEEEEA
jgi:RNA polymerase-binding transcription factor DksA